MEEQASVDDAQALTPVLDVDMAASACEAAFSLFHDAQTLAGVNDFAAAMRALGELGEILGDIEQHEIVLRPMLDLLAVDDPRFDLISAGLTMAASGADFVAAFEAEFRGTMAQQAAEFGMSASLLEQAADLYERLPEEFHWRGEIARARSFSNKGLKFIRDGARERGMASMDEAISWLRSKLYPLDRLSPAAAQTALITEISINISRFYVSLVDDIVKGRFSSAVDRVQEIDAELDELRETMKQCSVPEAAARVVSGAVDTMSYFGAGLCAFAQAGQAAQDRNWPTVKERLREARKRLDQARQTAVESVMAASMAAQITVFSDLSIEPARLHWEELQRVCTDAARWEENYKALAGKVGVQVNSTNSNTNTVEQRVDLNIQIANFFADRWQDALGDLRRALGNLPPDSAERQQLLKMIDEHKASTRNDPSWLDKAKDFTNKAAEIAGNVTKIAGPVGAALKVCAALCGVPLPF